MTESTKQKRVRWGGTDQSLGKDEVRDLWSAKGLAGMPEEQARARMEEQTRLVTYKLTLDALEHFLNKSPGGPDKRVLEIGCGWGRVFMGMKRRHPHLDYSGIDLAPNLVELSGRNAEKFGIAQPYEHFPGDAEDLSRFPDGTFDFAYSARVFQYVIDVDRAMGEAFRVLRPGGRLAILLPNGLNPIRRRRYTKAELPPAPVMRGWFERAGFEEIETRFLGFIPWVRQLPMGVLDRLAEAVGKLPGLRRFGVHVVVSGKKPG